MTAPTPPPARTGRACRVPPRRRRAGRGETPAPLVAAALLTCEAGAELHLRGEDGAVLRLAADEDTARRLAAALWQALDRAA